MFRVEASLAARLRAAGVDPDALADPARSWGSLHRRFGPRATLIDRYALDGLSRDPIGSRPRLAYTDAKTDFILDAMDAARAWADRTKWAV